MADAKTDKPGVIAPPPLIFLAGIFLGVLMNWYWPGSFWPGSARFVVAALLVAGSFFVVFLAFRRFSSAGTNVEPYKPTTAIVTKGPYGWSRNPIYLAMVGVTIGTGIALDNFWVIVMLAPVLLMMHFGVITREERYLTEKFGDEYRSYKNAVRRWL